MSIINKLPDLNIKKSKSNKLLLFVYFSPIPPHFILIVLLLKSILLIFYRNIFFKIYL